MGTVRCFIAVEIGPSVRQALALVADDLSKQLDSRAVRWVKPQNIHLTLRFLGETDSEALPLLGGCLDEVAAEIKPFGLSLAELGCFPNPRKPRVIWIGVGGQAESLRGLQRSVEDRLAIAGWQREGRRYHAHLTLGRVKNAQKVVAARLPWGRDLAAGSFEAAKICLVQSELRPDGAVYTDRHISALGGTSS
jgi:2'-5' RNA ligase